MIVEYVGKSHRRVIRGSDFVAAGFANPGDITWDRSNQFSVNVEDPVVAAWLIAQGDFQSGDENETFLDLVSIAVDRPTRLVQTVRTEGNFQVSASTEWKDLDSGGTVAARPLDVVLPNMRVGDFFTFRPFFSIQVGAYFLANVGIFRDGTLVRHLSAGAYGIVPWSRPNSQAGEVSTPSPRQQVQEGDLEADGSLRLRFRYTLTTSTRTIEANEAVPFILEAHGPFV